MAAVRQQIISIHALREEGDAAGTDGAQDQKHFYPRPPRGGRHISLVYPQKTALFLSTPSARRATPHSGRPSSQPADFYPRPPRGGRLKASVTLYTLPNFYPRPPRGGRPSTASTFTLTAYFYPRPPRGGRQLPQWVTTMIMNFYPRPPRGGRPLQIRLDETADRFLSTPSARRATFQVWPHLLGNPISIHALREEGDIQRRTGAVAHRISIHALREEGDPCQPDHRAGNLGFLSTPSARRATSCLAAYRST